MYKLGVKRNKKGKEKDIINRTKSGRLSQLITSTRTIPFDPLPAVYHLRDGSRHNELICSLVSHSVSFWFSGSGNGLTIYFSIWCRSELNNLFSNETIDFF